MNIQGNDLGIYVSTDGTAISDSWELIACSTSCSLSFSNATIETNCKGSSTGNLSGITNRITTPGQASWSISVDGLLDMTGDDGNVTDETGFVALMDLALDPTQTLYAAFATGDGQDVEYFGKVLISDISATAGVDDYATYSATLTGDGDLSERSLGISIN